MVHTIPLSAYTDEELGRLIRQAVAGNGAGAKKQVTARSAFAALFRMVGYGWVDDALEVAIFLWLAVKRLWKQIFR